MPHHNLNLCFLFGYLTAVHPDPGSCSTAPLHLRAEAVLLWLSLASRWRPGLSWPGAWHPVDFFGRLLLAARRPQSYSQRPGKSPGEASRRLKTCCTHVDTLCPRSAGQRGTGQEEPWGLPVTLQRCVLARLLGPWRPGLWGLARQMPKGLPPGPSASRGLDPHCSPGTL